MADELNQGVAESTAVPEVEAKPEAAPTAGQADTKGGATPDVLTQKMEGIEKLLGKWGNELGELRQFAQNITEQQQRAAYDRAQVAQAQQGPTGAADFDETEFLTKPKETIQKVLQGEFDRRDRVAAEQANRVALQEAFANFAEGKSRAMKESPELYEGIEKEIDADLYNAFRSGAIDRTALRNPEIYKTAAIVKRVMRGEMDKVSPARKSAPLTQTEVPGRGKQAVIDDEEDVQLDDETRQIAKQFGLSDKEAVETIKGETKIRRSGGRQGRDNHRSDR